MEPQLTSRCVGASEPATPDPGAEIAAFVGAGRSIIGTGIAAIIKIPAPWPEHLAVVTEFLERIESDNELGTPGTGPVALAALPFDTDGDATFVVPREIHGSDSEGRRWLTVIERVDHAGGEPSTLAPAVEFDLGFGDFLGISEPLTISVRSAMDPQHWCDTVEHARQLIVDGEVTKVVLSREILIETDHPLDPATIFWRLREMYPDSMTFAVDGFVGASPELLVSRSGDVVRAHPMAGTTKRTGDPTVDQQQAAELIASNKNRVEHQITIDMVHDRLLPWCSFLDAEPVPSVVGAGPVQHLATLVEGRLSQPSPSVLELVASLHPTPAVGGWPIEAALGIIGDLEPTGRGRYAGPTGWVDSMGNGAFAVSVRSAQLDGCSAVLRAGVGIVADSDPAAELEETRVKARALLNALVRV